MVHYFSIYLFGILYGVFDLESPGRNSLQSWEACIHDVSGIQSMNPVAICFFYLMCWPLLLVCLDYRERNPTMMWQPNHPLTFIYYALPSPKVRLKQACW